MIFSIQIRVWFQVIDFPVRDGFHGGPIDEGVSTTLMASGDEVSLFGCLNDSLIESGVIELVWVVGIVLRSVAGDWANYEPDLIQSTSPLMKDLPTYPIDFVEHEPTW